MQEQYEFKRSSHNGIRYQTLGRTYPHLCPLGGLPIFRHTGTGHIAGEGEAIQLQHELEEEQQAAAQLRAELAEHEADGKQLQATVARFQVLHGVAPTRVRESRDGRALSGALDQLRRLLVEAEGQAMQREMSGADDESEAKWQAERLRGQLAQQHARIV